MIIKYYSFWNNLIYKGNFKDKKNGEGFIYFKDNSYLKVFWKNDNIDENSEGIFNLVNENQYRKINLNTYEWINFIEMILLCYNGNKNKKSFSKSIYR